MTMVGVTGLHRGPTGTWLARVLACCLLLGGSAVWALDVPPLTGRIVDLAHLLPPDVAASLSAQLQAHETRTGNQVVLLTLPSLHGEQLEDFAHRVATSWKVGQKGTDNGVLVLVAPNDRKVRIEVGYGLEGTLTDARTSQIIRHEMVPRFKAGDYAGGIAAGIGAVLGTIEGTALAVPEPVDIRTGGEPTGFQYWMIGTFVGLLAGIVLSQGLRHTRALLGSVIAFLVAQSAGLVIGVAAGGVTLLLLGLLLSANRGGRGGGGFDRALGPGGGWGGSMGSGGGFSGGGGDFGGGGASGSW